MHGSNPLFRSVLGLFTNGLHPDRQAETPKSQITVKLSHSVSLSPGPAIETVALQLRNTGKMAGSVFVLMHPKLTQAESYNPAFECGILPAHSLLKR